MLFAGARMMLHELIKSMIKIGTTAYGIASADKNVVPITARSGKVFY